MNEDKMSELVNEEETAGVVNGLGNEFERRINVNESDELEEGELRDDVVELAPEQDGLHSQGNWKKTKARASKKKDSKESKWYKRHSSRANKVRKIDNDSYFNGSNSYIPFYTKKRSPPPLMQFAIAEDPENGPTDSFKWPNQKNSSFNKFYDDTVAPRNNTVWTESNGFVYHLAKGKQQHRHRKKSSSSDLPRSGKQKKSKKSSVVDSPKSADRSYTDTETNESMSKKIKSFLESSVVFEYNHGNATVPVYDSFDANFAGNSLMLPNNFNGQYTTDVNQPLNDNLESVNMDIDDDIDVASNKVTLLSVDNDMREDDLRRTDITNEELVEKIKLCYMHDSFIERLRYYMLIYTSRNITCDHYNKRIKNGIDDNQLRSMAREMLEKPFFYNGETIKNGDSSIIGGDSFSANESRLRENSFKTGSADDCARNSGVDSEQSDFEYYKYDILSICNNSDFRKNRNDLNEPENDRLDGGRTIGHFGRANKSSEGDDAATTTKVDYDTERFSPINDYADVANDSAARCSDQNDNSKGAKRLNEESGDATRTNREQYSPISDYTDDDGGSTSPGKQESGDETDANLNNEKRRSDAAAEEQLSLASSRWNEDEDDNAGSTEGDNDSLLSDESDEGPEVNREVLLRDGNDCSDDLESCDKASYGFSSKCSSCSGKSQLAFNRPKSSAASVKYKNLGCAKILRLLNGTNIDCRMKYRIRVSPVFRNTVYCDILYSLTRLFPSKTRVHFKQLKAVVNAIIKAGRKKYVYRKNITKVAGRKRQFSTSTPILSNNNAEMAFKDKTFHKEIGGHDSSLEIASSVEQKILHCEEDRIDSGDDKGSDSVDRSNILKNVESYLLQTRTKLLDNAESTYSVLEQVIAEIKNKDMAIKKLNALKSLVKKIEGDIIEIEEKIQKKYFVAHNHFNTVMRRNQRCADLEQMCLSVACNLYDDSYNVPVQNKELARNKLMQITSKLQAASELRRLGLECHFTGDFCPFFVRRNK